MKEFAGLTFLTMTEADIPVLTSIMKRAFDDDSRLFFQQPEGGPPGYDDGSFLRKWGLHANAEAYRIEKDGRPIGALILFIDEQRLEGHLGALFIDPDLIGRGIGTDVWRFVEHSHPHIKAWTTETPAVSYRNHRFYINRCGFHVVAVEGGENRFEALFRLRKEMPRV